jgi:glucose-1-phosphate adenylyltransferase
MDYGVMLAEHIETAADLTIASIEVPIEQAGAFGVMETDADDRVVAFHEKPLRPPCVPGQPQRALASMGIYIFSARFLYEALGRDAADPSSTHDFGHDVIPRLLGRARVHAHRFERSCVDVPGALGGPYWRDVGTVDAYWEAHMDLIEVRPQLNLYDDHWPVLSLQRQLAPAKFVFDDNGRRGMAIDSVVCSGCLVSGATVRRSLLSFKVSVEEDSLVEESVILPNVRIGRGVTLRRCVVDQGCTLPDGFAAGMNAAHDAARFHVTERGITLITPEMLGQGLHSFSDGASLQ